MSNICKTVTLRKRPIKNGTMQSLYLLDELHAVFAPHIDNVINHPIDYSTEKSMKTPLDATLYEVSLKCREILAHVKKWTDGNTSCFHVESHLWRFAEVEIA